MSDLSFNQLFNTNLSAVFGRAFRLVLNNPRSAYFLLKALLHQKKAKALRGDWMMQGIEVPPVMIISVTSQCNLRCKGCYSIAQNRKEHSGISGAGLHSLISEASQLGISVIILAGGEPLLHPDIFKIASGYPDIIFPVFTNGLLLTNGIISRLKRHRNIIPVISIEGDKFQTDERRGAGVFDMLLQKFALMKSCHIFYGVSITVNSENLGIITDDKYIPSLIGKGCRLFFLVEYVPVTEEKEYMALDKIQRIILLQHIKNFRKIHPAIFIGFPGDEEQYGGCLAAGRGFVHVSSDGFLEPCPFAPFSDSDLKKLSLKEALSSEMLKDIRGNHGFLSESAGGCALWANREWVKSLQNRHHSHNLDEP